ncbi:unnamed protein product [Colias eurytheme]|nr:unnamed protein product [Colias eurytheme]
MKVLTILSLSKTALNILKPKKVCTIIRENQHRNLMSKQLIYQEFGDPLQVVKYRECEVPPLGSQEVLVRMLAAPVNPADINTIQGKYPVKVELPSIPGNEGVGCVVEVGSDVKDIKKGNKVIVTVPLQGTWRNLGTFQKSSLLVVPDALGNVEAASLTVNPCTALRMLCDFVCLKEGDVVIQNGANSACGQNVIQICKAWGIKTVNVVRNRPDIAELKKYLQDLGATYVFTEEEMRKITIFKGEVKKPQLALNCVGGKSATELFRYMDHGGIMVTYGGMSREPVIVPTSAFIFKNNSCRGFWMTAWNKNAPEVDKEKMLQEIIKLMLSKQLKAPIHKMVKFDNYQEALKNALTPQGFAGCKYLFEFGRNFCLPKLPIVPGDEGVGEVVEVGSHVCTVEPDERVVITSKMMGTWRYYGIYHERDIHVISPNLPLPEASMLTTSPCMAYRMLRDFRKLKPGETIIQNAANSACGQSVIQLCRAWGINSINIVANHCGFESVKRNLLNLGATVVYTLEEAEELSSFTTSLTRPVLALNCLGGRYEDVLLKLLESNGTIVYYGFAFDLPLAKCCLRPDVHYNKFHLCDWDTHATPVQKDIMMNNIIQMMVIGDFKAPIHESIELKNYVHAFRNTVPCEAFSVLNYIFDFTMP